MPRSRSLMFFLFDVLSRWFWYFSYTYNIDGNIQSTRGMDDKVRVKSHVFNLSQLKISKLFYLDQDKLFKDYLLSFSQTTDIKHLRNSIEKPTVAHEFKLVER